MSTRVFFGNVSKKRNSTLRPTLTDYYDCTLKGGCTEDNPVFLINAETFSYNYAKWGDTYYFIMSVVYERQNLYRVHCTIDPLATYKDEILASTQFVSYSSVSGGTWLADTRIPVMQNVTVSASSTGLGIFNEIGGWYILSVIGENGCVTYAVTLSQLQNLITKLQENSVNQAEDIFDALEIEDLDDITDVLKAFCKGVINTDILGNAFSNAPSCIRSCTFVPLILRAGATRQNIYLGRFDTEVSAQVIDASPTTGSVSVSIPWQYSDWRRGTCEDVYLYLPLVGMIGLSSSSLVNQSSLTINYSYTLTDGQVAFQIVSGSEIIGNYGGSCYSNYAIGINQPTSLGDVAMTAIRGMDRTVSSAVSAGLNIVSSAIEAVAGSLVTEYETYNAALSTHPTTIGGIGGGAGFGLSHNVTCFTVAHPTVVEPSEMQATMGVPTMKPLQLSNCTGFCQCANAHVAINAHADVLNSVDAIINSGFFIE